MTRAARGRRGQLRDRLAEEAGRLAAERYPGELWRDLAPRLIQARPGATPAGYWSGAGRWLAAAAASVLLAVLALRQQPWSPRPGPAASPPPQAGITGTPAPSLQPEPGPAAVETTRGTPEPRRRSAGAAEAGVRVAPEGRGLPDARAAFGNLRPPASGFVPRPPASAPPPVSFGRGLVLGAAALGGLRPPNASSADEKEERR